MSAVPDPQSPETQADADAPDLEVLVVGAGPAGLTATAQLAARGVSCRLIEKRATPDTNSRALVVQPRTLELFAKMGLAERLRAVGHRAHRANVHVAQDKAISLVLGGEDLDETAYPFLLFVSEAETERVLTEQVLSLGVQIEREVELTHFTQDPEGITAQLHHASGTNETVRARYIVGCDGAHSQVRHDSGVSFRGAAYAQDFVLGDVRIEGFDTEDVHIFLPKRGMFIVLPMSGTHRARVIASGQENLPPGAAPGPTLAELQALAEAATGAPLQLSNATWLARFHLHHRGVDHYRVDRAFLAGDAAHIHSPAGGQGMNTGIQDAYNLAWKLALVLQGEAPLKLLDSYHEERWPVGRDLLRFTDRLFSLAATRNPVALSARRQLVPRVLRFATATAERRNFLFRFIGQLAINYRRSHIVGEDFGDSEWRQGPHAGDRAPDGPALLGTTGAPTHLHAALTGLPFHLLCFSGPQPAAAALSHVGDPRWPHLRIHLVTRSPDHTAETLVDSTGALHRRYGVSHEATYLIRPDGYVAFRAPRLESAATAAAVLRS